jgi:glycosyltransferase involved in cell wall biosynthesis
MPVVAFGQDLPPDKRRGGHGGAHVVVVPQRDGPVSRAQFPMKLADAMALAKPILCTAVGDVPEVVG